MISRLASWLAGLLAAAFGFAALVSGVAFVQLVRLPFTAQGRHFDDGVVHHAQALPVYGLLVLMFSVLAALSIWLSRRFSRRSRNTVGQGDQNLLEGIARGESAIAEDHVATQAEAKTRLGRWLK